uniref:Zgc:77752 n=1 Tax=Paramormyrops kingsleyae TaxID=1676925 RepID=A0A3B3SV66_9TELE|nr:protein tyrosine phosphatase domain-containing protein 1-like isoform X1 [Paramormyrops kingsleyae]
MTLPVPVPRPSYSQARETLVKAIPPKIICLLACGGRDCRYEGPECWRASQQAIRGLFSSWITENIVAMSRPSTQLIQTYNIIEQFHKVNIRSIINMQLCGEHAHCGPPLEPDSGFSYSPQIFMENGISFYNFGMPDFSVASLPRMLDAVKVLAFAVRQGRVAVHCHAGLGRTGVLIACYLTYELRVTPSEAVHYIRLRRPRSVQTRAQIRMVFSFACLLATQLVLYPDLSHRHGAPFSLRQHLQRQGLLLHGEEARRLKNVPKVVDFLCRRLVALAWGQECSHGWKVEVARRAAVLELTKVVRNTLLSTDFPVHLRDPTAWKPSICTGSSWDEQDGFLEWKREVFLNKRSYSDSDLGKVSIYEDLDFEQYPTLPEGGTTGELKLNGEAPGGLDLSAPRMQHCNGWSNTDGSLCLKHQALCCPVCAERSKFNPKMVPVLAKCTSSSELLGTNFSHLVSTCGAVAMAMAEQDPPGDATLRKSAALQKELNGNECGWAALATEMDPGVLSCLLWTWLEKLREPVLDGKDVDQLNNSPHGLKKLHKCQDQTICCLLRCISQVTCLCPQLEDSILRRLVRALTRCSLDNLAGYGAVTHLFRDTIRGIRQRDLVTGAAAQIVKKSRCRNRQRITLRLRCQEDPQL